MTVAPHRVTSFPQQLQAATADLHGAVEAVADRPGSVQTLGDYSDLLSALYVAHHQLEATLAVPLWDEDWSELGIDFGAHRRLDRLTEDLQALGRLPDPGPPVDLVLSSPAEALGCAYVVEGSAIGPRVLAPAPGRLR